MLVQLKMRAENKIVVKMEKLLEIMFFQYVVYNYEMGGETQFFTGCKIQQRSEVKSFGLDETFGTFSIKSLP